VNRSRAIALMLSGGAMNYFFGAEARVMAQPPKDPNDPRDAARSAEMAHDPAVLAAARTLLAKTFEYRYYLNFQWLGRPIVQYPQDIIALQEIVWDTKPTLIIETGVAHGGSLILYASLFELMKIDGQAIGVEIELRKHNEDALNAHPMHERIRVLKGSSTDPAIIAELKTIAKRHERVMVVLDSLHTHEHVLAELELYSPLVTPGNYLVCFGTSVADVTHELDLKRQWDQERNPKSALDAWLATKPPFDVDQELSDRLILSDGPGGYLRRR
jgi:cephalosporin hydroxylase